MSSFEPGSPCRLRSRSIMMCRCNALAMALDSFPDAQKRRHGAAGDARAVRRPALSLAARPLAGPAGGGSSVGAGRVPGGSRRPPPRSRAPPGRAHSAALPRARAWVSVSVLRPARHRAAPPYSPSRRFLCGLPSCRTAASHPAAGRISFRSPGLRGLAGWAGGADGSAGGGCSWCQTPLICPRDSPTRPRPAGGSPEVGGAGAPPVDEARETGAEAAALRLRLLAPYKSESVTTVQRPELTPAFPTPARAGTAASLGHEETTSGFTVTRGTETEIN